jgi:hypothetical protein
MLSRGKQSTPSGMRQATETEKEVMTYLIPIPVLGPVAGLAAKSTAKAVKKYGPDLVKMAKKFWTPVKRQTMKKGDRTTDESAFVVFKPGKTKSGSPNMSMKKVTKLEGQRMVAEKNARRLATLGTVAGVLGVAASGDDDKTSSSARNNLGLSLSGEIGEPGTVTDLGDYGKTNSKPELGMATKKKASLVDRGGKSPYSDDSTQDDYALRNKVSIRDKAKEENISESAAEQNLRRGGSVKKKKAGAAKTKYGMKKGGFTSKGGSYY